MKEIISRRKWRDCSNYEDGNAPGNNHCFDKERLTYNCKEYSPHDLDKKFYLHGEYICKRDGSKSATDEEYPLIVYAGRFLLILWILTILIVLISVTLYPDKNILNTTEATGTNVTTLFDVINCNLYSLVIG